MAKSSIFFHRKGMRRLRSCRASRFWDVHIGFSYHRRHILFDYMLVYVKSYICLSHQDLSEAGSASKISRSWRVLLRMAFHLRYYMLYMSCYVFHVLFAFVVAGPPSVIIFHTLSPHVCGEWSFFKFPERTMNSAASFALWRVGELWRGGRKWKVHPEVLAANRPLTQVGFMLPATPVPR